MNAENWLPTSGVNGLRSVPHLRQNIERRARVAVFGSFMGGYHVLRELLFGELAARIEVVGVATDDPNQPFTNAKVRLWKYPHTTDDEMLVRRFATAQQLPVFTGRVKSPEFRELILNEWRPDLCLMATFGQKIPQHLIELPRLGFFNFHHSGPNWPSYPGPDPIAAMQRDGLKHLVLTMHKVSDVIDDGEFVARSHPVALPPDVNAIEMHRINWPQMHGFIRRAVSDILASDRVNIGSSQAWTMHEQPVQYLAA
jgi:methionyl-tRNA formyltransferase